MRFTITALGDTGRTTTRIVAAIVNYLRPHEVTPGPGTAGPGPRPGDRTGGPSAYYADGGDEPGWWMGRDAETLGLHGQVDEGDFRSVLSGRKGDTRPLMQAETEPLGDYLEEWLGDRMDSLKPNTYSGYRDAIRTWIAPREPEGRWSRPPHLGAVPTCDVGPDHLTGLYAHLRKRGGMITKAERAAAKREGRKPVGKPLGTRSVQLIHTILRMALADAVESGKLPFNPAERVPKRQRPKHTAKNQVDRFWTPEQAKVFLQVRADDRLLALWAVAIDTGARRGELSARRWEDVDLEGGKVRIRKNRVLVDGEVVEGTTKTSRTRTVRLDRRTVAALKSWKKRQAQERMVAGPAASPARPATSGPTGREPSTGPTSCRSSSSGRRPGSGFPGSCSMGSGTRQRRSRWRASFPSTSCRPASDMPTSRSPGTSTPT